MTDEMIKKGNSTIVTKDGTSIYYRDWGTGQPIVFSHGWPLSGDAFEDQMFFLAQRGYRCIAADRRGHGRSSQPWEGNDLDTYADDLAELTAVLDLKDAIHVGHSTGGGEVARYIGRHGTDRVAKAVLIGAILFGYFLTVTQTPQKVTEFITGLGLSPIGSLVVIMLMYLVLGCLMDAMAMVILTVQIIFPAVTALGFDPIWFGVIIVMTVELGLIHPPVGMNVFVIKTVVQDVSFSTIFYGVIPFVVTDIVRLAVLIAFPAIATWLPGRM